VEETLDFFIKIAIAIKFRNRVIIFPRWQKTAAGIVIAIFHKYFFIKKSLKSQYYSKSDEFV
jgi:hypothetical protein